MYNQSRVSNNPWTSWRLLGPCIPGTFFWRPVRLLADNGGLIHGVPLACCVPTTQGLPDDGWAPVIHGVPLDCCVLITKGLPDDCWAPVTQGVANHCWAPLIHGLADGCCGSELHGLASWVLANSEESCILIHGLACGPETKGVLEVGLPSLACISPQGIQRAC